MTIFILYVILYSFATLGIFIIGALVFLRHQKNEYRSFALFTIFLGLWILLQFLGQMIHSISPQAAMAMLYASVTLPPIFCVIFYDFSNKYVGKPVSLKRHLVTPLVFALL